MQFAIPNPPRRVSLAQVPGALRRLLLPSAGALLLVGAFAFGARQVALFASAEKGFLGRAVEIEGRVSGVGKGQLTVLYLWEKREEVATVPTFEEYAQGLG